MITILRNSFREFMFISGEFIYAGPGERTGNFSQAWSRRRGEVYWTQEQYALAMALAFAPEAGPVEAVNPAEWCQIYGAKYSPNDDDGFQAKYMVLRFIELAKDEPINNPAAKRYYSAYMFDDDDGWDAGCWVVHESTWRRNRTLTPEQRDKIFFKHLPTWGKIPSTFRPIDRFTPEFFSDPDVADIIGGAEY